MVSNKAFEVSNAKRTKDSSATYLADSGTPSKSPYSGIAKTHNKIRVLRHDLITKTIKLGEERGESYRDWETISAYGGCLGDNRR